MSILSKQMKIVVVGVLAPVWSYDTTWDVTRMQADKVIETKNKPIETKPVIFNSEEEQKEAWMLHLAEATGLRQQIGRNMVQDVLQTFQITSLRRACKELGLTDDDIDTATKDMDNFGTVEKLKELKLQELQKQKQKIEELMKQCGKWGVTKQAEAIGKKSASPKDAIEELQMLIKAKQRAAKISEKLWPKQWRQYMKHFQNYPQHTDENGNAQWDRIANALESQYESQYEDLV